MHQQQCFPLCSGGLATAQIAAYLVGGPLPEIWTQVRNLLWSWDGTGQDEALSVLNLLGCQFVVSGVALGNYSKALGARGCVLSSAIWWWFCRALVSECWINVAVDLSYITVRLVSIVIICTPALGWKSGVVLSWRGWLIHHIVVVKAACLHHDHVWMC